MMRRNSRHFFTMPSRERQRRALFRRYMQLMNAGKLAIKHIYASTRMVAAMMPRATAIIDDDWLWQEKADSRRRAASKAMCAAGLAHLPLSSIRMIS